MLSQIWYYPLEIPSYRSLPSPKLVVWILSSTDKFDGHAKKRMYESGYRQNIQVEVRATGNFEIIASQDKGLERVRYDGDLVRDLPDCIIPRVGASVDYFGLAVIRQLEKMGAMILNEISSIEISRDKLTT